MPNASATNKGEPLSSYGTGESEDAASVEALPNSAGDALMNGLEDIKSALATLDMAQSVIVAKLALLEKAILTVQEDTTWLRGDVRVVHEVVENLADYVSLLNNTVAVVDGAPNTQPKVCAWGPWNGGTSTQDHGMVGTQEHAEEERIYWGVEEPSHIHGGQCAHSAVRETHNMERSKDIDGNITSMTEEGGEEEFYTSPEKTQGVFSPRGKQIQLGDESEAVDLGITQMEMTVDDTEGGTEAPGRSMWSDFTGAMGDIHVPALRGDINVPAIGGGSTSKPWVRSKRGRESWTAFGAGEPVEPLDVETADRGNLNLNLTPDGVDGVTSLNARGKTVAAKDTVRGSGSGAGGSTRGAGRVKRPPPVQPRYISRASSLTMD